MEHELLKGFQGGLYDHMLVFRGGYRLISLCTHFMGYSEYVAPG